MNKLSELKKRGCPTCEGVDARSCFRCRGKTRMCDWYNTETGWAHYTELDNVERQVADAMLKARLTAAQQRGQAAPPSAPARVEDMQRRLDREESDHARTIDQRDAAEDALGRMFQAVTGRTAEWSSAWGYVDAIEEVEEHVATLATERDQLAAALEAARAEVERLNRCLGRIVEGDGDSTLTIRAGTDAFAAAREYLSAHKPVPYDRKRIALELERTAMGDGYYGSALRAAKEFPEATPSVRALLDRWATGKQRGLSDRTDLCAFALQIYMSDLAKENE